MSFTLSLSDEASRALAETADAQDQPPSQIIEQALEHYLAARAWWADAIDEGIAAADNGQLIAHDRVVEWVKSWEAGSRKALPQP